MAECDRASPAHRGVRCEWRCDLFASELESVRHRLAEFHVIEREFEKTVTIFLSPVSDDIEFDKGIRLRAYANLRDSSPDAIGMLLSSGIKGKLQAKHANGCVDEHGEMRLAALRDGPIAPVCTLDGIQYVPRSIRVSSRLHFGLHPDGKAATLAQLSERHRVTLDGERRLYRLRASGDVAYLGAMGPRLEIKTSGAKAVAATLTALKLEGMPEALPWRGIELVMQDILRDLVDRRSIVPGREIELKFDVRGEISFEALQDAMRSLPDARLVLPYPHAVMRMRRYHVCASDSDPNSEFTIVETPSGLLSQKHKRDVRQHGPVLVRETSACHTTDRDGEQCSVDEFARRRRLTRVNSYTKHQSKIPFCLRNGHVYLASFDHCVDVADRMLRQLEIEFVGTRTGELAPTTEIVRELERLAAWLQGSRVGRRLVPSTSSKHAFFGRSLTTAASPTTASTP